MDEEEKDFLEDEIIKPKKQLSEQKLEHLKNIRVKALEKKKQMKEITEKANKLKEIETLKEAKKIQKEQLAKQYDEMIAKQKEEQEQPRQEEIKEEPAATSGRLVGGSTSNEPKQEVIKPKEEIKPIKRRK